MNNDEKILQMLEQMSKRFDKIENDIKDLKDDTELIRTSQKEHKDILSAILHSQEVHKSELDKLNIETAKITGSIKNLSNDLYSTQELTGKNYIDIARLKKL